MFELSSLIYVLTKNTLNYIQQHTKNGRKFVWQKSVKGLFLFISVFIIIFMIILLSVFTL